MAGVALSAILILVGLYFGARNLRLLRDNDALRQYISASPKAAAWVQRYGVDGAMKLAKETFIPLGLLMCVALIGVGLWSLGRAFL